MKKLIVKLAFNILRKEYDERYWAPAFAKLKEYGLEIIMVGGYRPAIFLLEDFPTSVEVSDKETK